MADSRIKLTNVVFSSQATVLFDLPDIPGRVVQVGTVIWMVNSFTAPTGIALVLHHNISLNVTLSVNDFASAWCRIDQAASNGGPPPGVVFFDPPYELIGRQRFDHVASAGAVIGTLSVIYTLRNEPNTTIWNELRRRTSFEKG